MNGYTDSRRILLSCVPARALPLAILGILALAACGGGGGGDDDDGGTTTPTNAAPTANAGADKSAAFPETVSLTGTASDPENATLTYTWSQTAGPGTTTFTAANALTTDATFSAPGSYTLRLSVSDGTNTATDDVAVAITALYPTTTWTTATPAEVNLTTAKLDEAMTYATSKPRNFSSGTSDGGGSGVVIRYGKLVYQWGSQTQTYDVKSTTKSIGGIALLLALDDSTKDLTLSTTGRSKLDSFGTPPANDDTWRTAVTVGQLATHSAGFEKPDAASTSDDGELLNEPGTRWRYSDSGLNWLADVLTMTFNDDLSAVLTTRVFTPLGIGSTALTWRDNALRTPTLTGSTGNTLARRELASGMRASVDAMARIGYLFLRKGVWNTDRIIAESSVTLVQTPQSSIASLAIEPTPSDFPSATAHYGVLWWTNKDGAISGLPTDAYWAWGLGESLIVVIPSLDLVVARAGVPDEDGVTETRAWNTEWNGDYAVLAPFLRPLAEAVTN